MNQRWLCLDCGKNTFEGNENYYVLKHRLWRQLVAREQRHGMICRACIQRRLGRPLVPEDFGNVVDDESDPLDQPMGEEDYGIYDSLTPGDCQAIDSAIIEFVLPRPRKVVRIVLYMCDLESLPVSALHDWFYADRIVALIEEGALRVVTEGKNLLSTTVTAANSMPERRE